MTTFLEEYGTKVLDGKIIACDKIKKIYHKLLDDMYVPKGPYIFSQEHANRPIEFIETFCKQAQGRLGSPLSLELFQKAKFQATFGFIHEETLNRKHNEILTIEGRKNGKTTEMAAVENYLLVGDNEGSPEVYNIATKLDQAKKGFDEAHKMVKQSPDLRKHIRKRQSDLYCDFNMGYIKALASNSNSLDGLNSHGVIIDELGAIKNRDIYDLMKQSMSAREQPLLFCITTNGFVRNSIFDAQYEYACGVLDGSIKNEHFLPFIYELDDRSEWEKEECWIKANPGLGSIKSIHFLRECVAKAKDDDSFKATVMVKDFNMKENGTSVWLKYEHIENNNYFDFKSYTFKYGIGGFDAADTTDLNSAKAICMRPGDDNIYVRSMYWIPKEVLDRMTQDGNRRERDSVPYTLWEQQGLLRTHPGNKVDKRVFLEWFKELRDEGLYVLYIGYDPWHIDDTLLREFKAEFGEKAMIPVRQGVYTMSDPMKELKADLRAKRIIHNNHPIDMWCLSNTEIKTDINANIQPLKGTDPRKRIDGTISLICAYIALRDHMDEYKNVI